MNLEPIYISLYLESVCISQSIQLSNTEIVTVYLHSSQRLLFLPQFLFVCPYPQLVIAIPTNDVGMVYCLSFPFNYFHGKLIFVFDPFPY